MEISIDVGHDDSQVYIQKLKVFVWSMKGKNLKKFHCIQRNLCRARSIRYLQVNNLEQGQ